MDGTKAVHAVELYLHKYLVGKQFPTDARQFLDKPPIYTTPDELSTYVNKVGLSKSHSTETYSLNLTDRHHWLT